MNRHLRIACLLLVGALAATPGTSFGQSTGFTVQQYDVLEERVQEFCEYLFALKRDGKMLPISAVKLPGAGDGYVYGGGEVVALIPKCDSLMPLMLQMMKPVR